MKPAEFSFRRAGCYLGESAAPSIINSEIIIAAGSGVLPAGAVLGTLSASGKRVAYDPDASSGAENADAILFAGVDATSQDIRCVATTDGPATVNPTMLWFQDGVGDTDPAFEDLGAHGIKVMGFTPSPGYGPATVTYGGQIATYGGLPFTYGV